MLPNPVNHLKGTRRKELPLEVAKKEYPYKAEPVRTQYNPFDSPHILRMPPVTPVT